MVAQLDQLPSSPDNGNNPNKKHNRLKKGIGALVLSGLAILGYETVIKDHVGHDVDQIALDTARDGIAERKADATKAERPANLTLDNATPDQAQFFNDRYFTADERLDWAYSVLNRPSTNPKFEGKTLLEEHYAAVEERFNSQAIGGYRYIRDLVPQSENMTADEIFTLFSTIQDIQQNSDLPEDTKLKLSGAIYDGPSPAFNYQQKMIKEGTTDVVLRAANVSATNNLTAESPVFHDGTLPNGYVAAGIPSKVVDGAINGIKNSYPFQATIQFHNGRPLYYSIEDYKGGDRPLSIDYIQSIPAN